MRIAGIDPGANRIGYALVEMEAGKARLLHAETIVIPGCDSGAERLKLLERELERRLKRDRPDVCAVEKLYFAKNAKTALAVAEARGVILLTAGRRVNSIWEYAPLEVKMCITGYGRGDKFQVRGAVRASLPGSSLPAGDDAVDAVALALTAVYTKKPKDDNASK